MRYKLFGKSGLRVSELCLGAMTFGENGSTGASKEDREKIYHSYRETGGNFIDTANRYSFGESERILGNLIKGERDSLVLSTKYSRALNMDDPNSSGNHRKNLVQSLDASLKRLNTEYIDLYWVHIWDPLTPIEETMRALDDMVRMGKILYIGISNAPAWIISRGNCLAELSGWTQFIGLQIQYSLVERSAEREHIPMAEHLGLGITTWGTLGSGVLSGKYNKGKTSNGNRAELLGQVNERKLEIASVVCEVAEEIGCTPSQIALNWVRQRFSSFVPILGVRTLSQLEDNLACLQFTIPDDQMERLNKISSFDPGYPYDLLNTEDQIKAVYGDVYTKIDPK